MDISELMAKEGKGNKKQKMKIDNSINNVLKEMYKNGDVIAGWKVLAREKPHQGTKALLDGVIKLMQQNGANSYGGQIIHTAVDAIAACKENEELRERLAHLYIDGITCRSPDGERVLLEPDEEKAFECIKYATDELFINFLVEKAEKIQSASVSLSAAFYLEKHRKIKDSNIDKALFTDLDRALQSPDLRIEELIEAL